MAVVNEGLDLPGRAASRMPLKTSRAATRLRAHHRSRFVVDFISIK